jgi:hypothetical protein
MSLRSIKTGDEGSGYFPCLCSSLRSSHRQHYSANQIVSPASAPRCARHIASIIMLIKLFLYFTQNSVGNESSYTLVNTLRS